MNEADLEVVRYDVQTGLVPVIVQDETSKAVLMLAYANREALKRTMATGEAWFWSRSRQSYWHKGETSGNRQLVREIRVDCDGDSVLYLVRALGPACHTGETTCFYRRVSRNSSDRTTEDDLTDKENTLPKDDAVAMSDAAPTEPPVVADALSEEFDPAILSTLWSVVMARYRDRPQGSYTTYLFEQGIDKAAKKVGEEAVEVAIAAKNAVLSDSGERELASESADLLFHLLVLWRAAGLQPDKVWKVLEDRHGK